MKLSYGFLCDYCEKKIYYTEKTSIVYEKYTKSPKYDKVKSFNCMSGISLDLCPECAKKVHLMLERKRKIKSSTDAYLEVCRKHQIKMNCNQ